MVDTTRFVPCNSGGHPLRKYTLLHMNRSTDEDDILVIWWMRRLKEEALRSTEVVESADLLQQGNQTMAVGSFRQIYRMPRTIFKFCPFLNNQQLSSHKRNAVPQKVPRVYY
jgi:hypothetical protein